MSSPIRETALGVRKEVSQLWRKRPVNVKNRTDYLVLAFEMERIARDIREKAVAVEPRSFGKED